VHKPRVGTKPPNAGESLIFGGQDHPSGRSALLAGNFLSCGLFRPQCFGYGTSFDVPTSCFSRLFVVFFGPRLFCLDEEIISRSAGPLCFLELILLAIFFSQKFEIPWLPVPFVRRCPPSQVFSFTVRRTPWESSSAPLCGSLSPCELGCFLRRGQYPPMKKSFDNLSLFPRQLIWVPSVDAPVS